ncbi:MAG: PHP domain-containing protein, partial [Pseudomonadota bacterium]
MTAKPHHADFVHLRVHSAYSLSEGAIKVKDMVKLAVDAAMPAVAVCDTGNLFGALEFSFAARDSGVQPIIGCLLGVTRDDADQRLARRPPPDRLPVLVQNETGYLNLLHLVSKAFLDSDGGDDPQVALADMEGHTDGLIALTGGPG